MKLVLFIDGMVRDYGKQREMKFGILFWFGFSGSMSDLCFLCVLSMNL